MVKRYFYSFQDVINMVGDAETLRQSLLINRVRAFVELALAPGTVHYDEENPPPANGSSEYAQWRRGEKSIEVDTEAEYLLSGWFFVPYWVSERLYRREELRWRLTVWPEMDHFPVYEFEIDSEHLQTMFSLQFFADDIDSLMKGVAVSGMDLLGDERRHLKGLPDPVSTPMLDVDLPPEAAPRNKIRSDREESLLRVVAGLWEFSGLPKEATTAADRLSSLFDSWGWEKPASGTIADTILARAGKLPRNKTT